MLYIVRGCKLLKFFQSAFKHVSESQIREALADPMRIYEEFPDDDDGNPQDLTIGMTIAEVILEIGIKYKEDDDCVFHASEATKQRQQDYRNTRR